MGNLSKTARKSGIKTPGVVDPFDTNEKKIKELRKAVSGSLFVRPDFIVALLEEYDKLAAEKEKGKDAVDFVPLTLSRHIVRPSPSEILQADLEPLPETTEYEAIDYNAPKVEEHHIDPILHEVGMIDHGGEAG